MKSLILNFLAVLFLFATSGCKQNAEKDGGTPVAYSSFGDSVTPDNRWGAVEMDKKFTGLRKTDTIPVKFTSTILEVCPKKGCWMKVQLDGGREAMVRFKDYGFFVPKDASGEVVIEGKAYVEEMSVKDLRHYAKDAGKTEEEIAQITEPRITYAVEANGVLIKQ
ncbi:DUF4920 domain-containing protein [Sinomicrobium pectinilyticum]|uniref:DUF4920 domain-containing protein n=1 Tax=Sinomicrobium pectinilyticum TaxID=1084421 RepID=A0A3N0E4L1_SINP1|nr:DUF4920 domain-containing protein [Sinomicrobium pectinilyticum]RNL82781.1 DUF4920 domain-containing protein [Sinomicrobium pectinilyticum]